LNPTLAGYTSDVLREARSCEMKESVLDILIYLFENYFDADLESAPEPDRETLKDELERAGFSEREVARALEWLEQLSADPQRTGAIPASRAIRIFDPSEQARLDTDCRGYILYLENIGILNAAQRELVIDRLLALDARQIDIEQVKWVVLMVLFSQPGQESAYLRMEDLVFDNRLDAVH
jgi:Smg protein